jgi:hypothetical protein
VKKDLAALKVGNPMTAVKNEIAPVLNPKNNDFDKYFGDADETPKP